MDYRHDMDTDGDSTDSYNIGGATEKRFKKKSPIRIEPNLKTSTTTQEQQQNEFLNPESAMPDNPSDRLKALKTKLRDTPLRVIFTHKSKRIYTVSGLGILARIMAMPLW